MNTPLNDPATLQRAQDIFRSVCDLETHEQAIAVDQACGSEVGLRFAVEALLSADRVDGDPLSDRAIDEQQDQAAPAVIDGFRIIRELGRGGMGVVYEAEQDSPSRRVALKLIRSECPTRILRSRLRREAEVLGMLQHPGIAQIYKTSEFEGRHYIAMELIDGDSLLDAAQSMPFIDRVNLLIRVIDAVHYAHQKGVIHRDLKPENVLVTRPSQSAEHHPKIVDFGIARATGDTNRATLAESLTIGGGGSLIGTLAYMAPEQLEGGGDADVRSDVYALGMIAYALLTGSQAVDVRGLPVAAAVRAVMDAEPKRAGAVNPRLRGDVETIIHKSIHPDRERRYQSAFEFSADLRRHLAREPISARAPSAGYVLGRVIARNRGLFAGALLALLAIIGGGVAAVFSASSERRLRNEAQALLYSSSLTSADRAITDLDYERAEQQLAAAPEHLRGWEWYAVKARLIPPTVIAATDIRRGMLWRVCDKSAQANTFGIALLGATDRGIESHQVAGGVTIEPVRIDPGFIATIVDAVLTEPPESAIMTGTDRLDVRLVSLESGDSQPLEPPEQYAPVAMLKYGDRFEFKSLGDTAVYRADTFKSVAEIVEHPTHGRVFAALSNVPEAGRHCALAVCVLDRAVISRVELPAQATVVEWSPDRRRLFATHFGGRVSCIDPTDGSLTSWGSRMLDSTAGTAIAVSTDGAFIAFAFDSGRTAILDSDSGAVRRSYVQPHGPIRQLLYDNSSASFLGASASGVVYRFSTRDEPGVLRGHSAAVNPICLVSGGRRLLSGSWDGSLRVWDVETGVTDLAIQITDGEGNRMAVLELASSPDGVECAVVATRAFGLPPTVLRYDLKTGGEIDRVIANASGRIVPFYTPDCRLHLFSTTLETPPSDTELHSWMFGSFATAPTTGQHPDLIAHTDHRGWVFVHRVDSAEIIRRFPIAAGPAGALVLAPDGRRVGVAGVQSIFRIYDSASGKLLAELDGHTGEVLGAAWSPDATRLATASRDGTIGIWDGRGTRKLATLSAHADYVYAVRWSDDGSKLFSSSGDGTIRVWGAEAGELTTPRSH